MQDLKVTVITFWKLYDLKCNFREFSMNLFKLNRFNTLQYTHI